MVNRFDDLDFRSFLDLIDAQYDDRFPLREMDLTKIRKLEHPKYGDRVEGYGLL